MGKAYFSKKQKAQMRERQKKKKLAMTNGKASLDVDDDTKQQQVMTSTTDAGRDGEEISTKINKKRMREAQEEEEATTTTSPPLVKKGPLALRTRIFDGTMQVALPSNLSSQEAKKFRKDARRQLRKQNQYGGKNKNNNGNEDDDDDNMEIEFIDEDEMPMQAQKKHKKTTKHYPSIKELREQKRNLDQLQKEETKRQEKIQRIPDEIKSQYLALDCEMVGIGSDGKKSALARVSIVDWKLDVLLDTYVQVPIRVTDFRTHVSGVEPKHIHPKNNPNAMDVAQCRTFVASLLKDKVLVGHALSNDLKALMLTHPKSKTRDTAKYRPFQRYGNNKWRARKLRDLVQENLPKDKYDGFQQDEHDSVHDAKATMELFQLVRNQWEKELANKTK